MRQDQRERALREALEAIREVAAGAPEAHDRGRYSLIREVYVRACGALEEPALVEKVCAELDRRELVALLVEIEMSGLLPRALRLRVTQTIERLREGEAR